MLLAEVINEGAVWGLLGAAVTATGAVVIKIMMTRHQVSQDERNDLRAEWRELLERQQGQITDQNVRIKALEEENITCRQENATLKARVSALEDRVAPRTGGPPA